MPFENGHKLLKLSLTVSLILYLNLCNCLFAQTQDSIYINSKFHKLDKVNLLNLDSLFNIKHVSSQMTNYWESAPRCSCLKLKNGKFYLKKDSLPYNGSCVVTNINTKNCDWDLTFSFIESDSINNLSFIHPNEYIKIISNYSNGKRDGNRFYFNKKGNLLKYGVYENGILIETIY